LFNIIMVI